MKNKEERARVGDRVFKADIDRCDKGYRRAMMSRSKNGKANEPQVSPGVCEPKVDLQSQFSQLPILRRCKLVSRIWSYFRRTFGSDLIRTSHSASLLERQNISRAYQRNRTASGRLPQAFGRERTAMKATACVREFSAMTFYVREGGSK